MDKRDVTKNPLTFILNNTSPFNNRPHKQKDIQVVSVQSIKQKLHSLINRSPPTIRGGVAKIYVCFPWYNKTQCPTFEIKLFFFSVHT